MTLFATAIRAESVQLVLQAQVDGEVEFKEESMKFESNYPKPRPFDLFLGKHKLRDQNDPFLKKHLESSRRRGIASVLLSIQAK